LSILIGQSTPNLRILKKWNSVRSDAGGWMDEGGWRGEEGWMGEEGGDGSSDGAVCQQRQPGLGGWWYSQRIQT